MISAKDSRRSGKTDVQKVVIQDDYDGQRVDNYLLRVLKGVPKSRIYRLIRKGEVRINGKRVRADTRLVPGDQLRIPPVRTGNRKVSKKYEKNILERIIYENKVIYVINKPAGLAVHGGSGISSGAIESLRACLPDQKLELMHRLDRDTSGCLMIARNRRYLRIMQEAFRTRSDLGKYYRVIVHGSWSGKITRVDAPIVKNTLKNGERVSSVSSMGKPSITDFRVLAQSSDFSLLEAQAITGRTHQIRVHCRYTGHPVVGDKRYGDLEADARALQYLKNHRLMLHASRLEIPDLEDFPGFNVNASVDSGFESFEKNLFNKDIKQ